MKVRIYNTILNPNIWIDENTINPEIRAALLKIANDFYTDLELKAPIVDVLLLGSSANYNWSDKSDIDLHIVVDFNKISPDIEIVKKFVDFARSKWNSNHNIKIKGHNIEVYIQDASINHRSTGIFSLLKNAWVKKPNKLIIKLDNNLIQNKFTQYVYKINDAVKSNNIDKLKNVSKDIYDMREVGLSTYGEFSTENIVFKLLRSKNYIELIKNKIRDIYDNQMSIK